MRLIRSPYQDLSGVAETSLIALYLRAMESQRPDALIKHEKAVALVARMGDAIERIKGFPMTGESIASATWRSQEFDRRTRDFLAAHPDGIVVSIGCGLDTRFDRVDNGTDEVCHFRLKRASYRIGRMRYDCCQ